MFITYPFARMTLSPKLKSRKLWAFITGVVATVSAFFMGDINAGQALAALVPLVLGYIGVQGYVDGKTPTAQ